MNANRREWEIVGRAHRGVAQNFILLYRGFAIRWAKANPAALLLPTHAEYNSAIQQIANLRYIGCGFAALGPFVFIRRSTFFKS